MNVGRKVQKKNGMYQGHGMIPCNIWQQRGEWPVVGVAVTVVHLEGEAWPMVEILKQPPLPCPRANTTDCSRRSPGTNHEHVAVHLTGKKDLLSQLFPLAPKLAWIHSRSAGVDSALFPELIESDRVSLTNAR